MKKLIVLLTCASLSMAMYLNAQSPGKWGTDGYDLRLDNPATQTVTGPVTFTGNVTLSGTNSVTGYLPLTAVDDSLKSNWLPRVLAIPTYIDTTAQDSIVVEPYFLATGWPDSAVFIRYRSTSFAATDSLRAGVSLRLDARPDSFVVYTRADAVGGSEAKLHLMVRGRSGTSYLNQVITPVIANAWERWVYYRAAAVKPEDVEIKYIPLVEGSHKIDVTGVTVK